MVEHDWDAYDVRTYWSAAATQYLRKWWCARCGWETVQPEASKPASFTWPDGKGFMPRGCDEELVESVLTS